MEEWRKLVGKEANYEVSSKGRIKRLSYLRKYSNQTGKVTFKAVPDRILKGSVDSSGYIQVNVDGRSELLHRLIAETFLEPPSKELVEECKAAGLDYVPINHKDHNRLNNAADNLEWASPSKNAQDVDYDYCKTRGERSYCAKLKERDVDEILKLSKTGMSQQAIADLFGVNQITISNILTGRSWAWYTGIPKTARCKNKGKRSPKSMSEQNFSVS